MTTDQNPIKKPLTIRLADRLAEGITTGHDWPNTNDELLRLQAAATLRTQHALLERARDALASYQSFIDDAHILEGQWHWLDGVKQTAAAITVHLEPKP